MKKRNRKVAALLLAACLTAAGTAGCGNDSGNSGSGSAAEGNSQGVSDSQTSTDEGDSGTGSTDQVTLRIFMHDQSSPDDKVVQDYINNLPQVQALNVQIEIVKQAGGAGEHKEKIPLLLATNEQMDIGWDEAGDFANRIVQNAYVDISSYLEADSEFYDMIPEALWNGMRYEGGIYGVPTYKEIAEQWAVSTDTYILDKYEIDPASITDFLDLETLFAANKEEGDRSAFLLKGDQYHYILRLGLLDDYDFVNGYNYAVVKHDEGKTVVSPFETEEFAEIVRAMYDWNKKGYIHPDALTIQGDDDFLKGGLKKGEVVTSYSPLAELRWAEQNNWESTTVLPLTGAPKVTNASARGSVFGIYAKSKNPDKAYEFLKLWNTDPEVKNAFYLGVPGVHYEVVDGKAREVKDRYNIFSGQNWTTGNNLISILLEGEPDDKWEQFEAWNQTAVEANDLGICLNVDSISDKQAAVTAVMAEYLPPLVFGFVEPESGLEQLNEQLKTAGIDEIISEIQTQYDAFLATK